MDPIPIIALQDLKLSDESNVRQFLFSSVNQAEGKTRIICTLYLIEAGKEKVMEIIRHLDKLDFVGYAQPGFIIPLVPVDPPPDIYLPIDPP